MPVDTDLGPLPRRKSQRQSALPQDGEAERLRRIEAALTRLEDGRFGFCEACGAQIDIARLKVDPTVGTCGACAGED